MDSEFICGLNCYICVCSIIVIICLIYVCILVALIDLSTSCIETPSEHLHRDMCNLLDVQERNQILQRDTQNLKLKLEHAEERCRHLKIDLETSRTKSKHVVIDMNLKISNGRFQNKKLTDENKNLLLQLDTSEEVINSLNHRIEENGTKLIGYDQCIVCYSSW